MKSFIACPWILLSLVGVAFAQVDDARKEAGVCARCHVISVAEWGFSRHRQAATDCVACHGASEGHVIDERNNVKPDQIPRRAAVAEFCRTCHEDGCPKSTGTSVVPEVPPCPCAGSIPASHPSSATNGSSSLRPAGGVMTS